MKLEALAEPVVGPGQVLVRVHAAGVNPVETYIRSGNYAKTPPLPYTPGSDGAGVVAGVGSDVTDFSPGTRVYMAGSLSGTYAEFALCSASQVHPLPDNVSYAQGACLGVPYATAWRALMQRGEARRGETVLIHGGSGGVGVAAIQIAKALGLQVFATAGTETGRLLLRDIGAHAVFDHHAEDLVPQVLGETSGQGVDLILEMLANQNLAKDLAMLAPRGRLLVIGSRGTVEIDPRAAMTREADIRGVLLFMASPAELKTIHSALYQGLASGELSPRIGQEFPLSEAASAHETIMQPGSLGKLVLIP